MSDKTLHLPLMLNAPPALSYGYSLGPLISVVDLRHPATRKTIPLVSCIEILQHSTCHRPFPGFKPFGEHSRHAQIQMIHKVLAHESVRVCQTVREPCGSTHQEQSGSLYRVPCDNKCPGGDFMLLPGRVKIHHTADFTVVSDGDFTCLAIGSNLHSPGRFGFRNISHVDTGLRFDLTTKPTDASPHTSGSSTPVLRWNGQGRLNQMQPQLGCTAL